MNGAEANKTEFCLNQHSTYTHRIDNPDNYNWCSVEHKPWDVILIAGIAIVVACLAQGPYSSLIVLVTGGVVMGFAYPFNLREIGNGLSLWLGIQPYELFFYIFLPPLLLDAALKIDWYAFKKVALNVVTLAFLVVIGTCAILIPVLLYVFRLKSQGWEWYDAALFGSMIASTDAVAIIAVLKKSGGPENLRLVLEGESLLNDASSITLFIIFISFVIDAAEGTPNHSSAGHIIGDIIKQMLWLAIGGGLIGLAFGIATRQTLRVLQRFGASFEQQIAMTFAGGYLSFYVANAPAAKSGVISVAVYGLYGAATSKFDISSRLEESGTFDGFWDSFAFMSNGIVFFFAGASSLNFVIRSSNSLGGYDRGDLFSSLWRAPLVWMVLNVLRFLIISFFKPLFHIGKAPLTFREVMFLSASGLRGSVSLILAQAVVTEVPNSVNPEVQKVQSEIVLFTAVFVLLTLLVNAPMLPYVLKFTKLDRVPPQHQKMRQKALRLLVRETEVSIAELREDADDMLRGVDWVAVHKYVDVSKKLESFANPHQKRSQSKLRSLWARLSSWCSCWQQCCFGRRRHADDVLTSLDKETLGDVELGAPEPRGEKDEDNSAATISDATDSAWKIGSHDATPRRSPQSDTRENRSEHDTSDFDDADAEGEVPFLTREPMSRASGSILGRQDQHSTEGLPTHLAPPKRHTTSFDQSGKQHTESPGSSAEAEVHNISAMGGNGDLVRHGASAPERPRSRRSMSYALQSPCSNLELGIEYSNEDSARDDGLSSSRLRNSASISHNGTARPATDRELSTPVPDPDNSCPRPQVATEATDSNTNTDSHDGTADHQPSAPDMVDPLSGFSSEHTIRRHPKGRRGSLAGLFGGATLDGGSAAAPPTATRPLLSDLFATAPAHLETFAESRAPDSPSSAASTPTSTVGSIPCATGQQRATDHSELPAQGPRATLPIQSPSTAASDAQFRDSAKGASIHTEAAPVSIAGGAPSSSRADLPGDSPRQQPQSRRQPKCKPRHTGYEDAEAGADEAGDASNHAAGDDGNNDTSDFVCEAPSQRYGFRAKRTEALNHRSAMVEVGGTSAPVFGTSATDLYPKPSSPNKCSSAWENNSIHPAGQDAADVSMMSNSNDISTAALLSNRDASQRTWHTGVLPKRTHVITPLTSQHRGSMGAGSQDNGGTTSTQPEVPELEAEEVADMRARIYAGMKRYFYGKASTGLLSHKGLRILDHCCDLQIDDPITPLALWEGVEGEVAGGWLQAFMVRVVFKLRRFGIKLKRSEWKLLSWFLIPPVSWLANIGQRLLSKQLLLSCEVAMEYLLALTNSPQVQLLREHNRSTALMKEVEAESKRVWQFVINRELEAPERFRSIQSYRAAMAVLRQQENLVERMVHSGMVNQQEGEQMGAPIEEAVRLLVHRGPVWRAPRVIDVLRSLPIMRDVPSKALEQVLATGRLIMYRSDRQIHESAPHEGIFIVVSGLVRVRYDVWQGIHQTYFLGTGGIFGLFSALTGESLEGRAVAIAEGNALGKGPVVFELPLSGVALIRNRASEGDPVFMQLEVDMFRLAALYVLERMEPTILAQLYSDLSAHRAAKQCELEEGSTADGSASPEAIAAATLRLRSLFGPPPTDKPVDGDGSDQHPLPSPPIHATAAKQVAHASSRTAQVPTPRNSSIFGARQSMAWMLNAANSEDTVAELPKKTGTEKLQRPFSHEAPRGSLPGSAPATDHRSIQRQAEAVSNGLRLQLWGAELMELPPGSSLPYRCSVVVLRGVVDLTSPATASRRTDGRTVKKVSHHHAPAVLPWLWDVPSDSLPTSAGDHDAPLAAAADMECIQVSVEGRLTAGSEGATLLVAAADDSLLDDLLWEGPDRSLSAIASQHVGNHPATVRSRTEGSEDDNSNSFPRGLASVTGIRSAFNKSRGTSLMARTFRAMAPEDTSNSQTNYGIHQPGPSDQLQPGQGSASQSLPRNGINTSYDGVSGSSSAAAVTKWPPVPLVRNQERRPTMQRRSSRRLILAGTSTGELHQPRSIMKNISHQVEHSTVSVSDVP